MTNHDGDRFVFRPSEQDKRSRNKMLSSVVVPRPIAMISTVDPDGHPNVAPYSYYQPITWEPMLIGVAMGMRGADRRADTDDHGLKDTFLNIEATGDFVVNVTTDRFRDHIESAATEFPHEISEFDHIPWTPVPSLEVRSPSVAEAPARLECTVHDIIEMGRDDGRIKYVVGEVVCVVVEPALVLEDMWVDDMALAPIGRLGGRSFLRTIPDAVYSQERIRYEPHLHNSPSSPGQGDPYDL